MEKVETAQRSKTDTLEDHIADFHLGRAGYSRIEGSGWHEVGLLDVGKIWWLLQASTGFLWNGKRQKPFSIGTTQLKKTVGMHRAKDEEDLPIMYGLLDDGSHFYICRLNKL